MSKETVGINMGSIKRDCQVPKSATGRINLTLLTEDQRIELLETEATKFFENTQKLSRNLLTQERAGWLLSAISRYYPGGLAVLKTKLESVQDNTPIAQIDKKTKTYVDDDGNNWVVSRHIEKTIRMTTKTVRHHLKGLEVKDGRDQYGRKTLLYRQKEALEKLKDRKLLVEIDENGKYVDDKGEVWVVASAISLPNDVLRKIKDGLVRSIGGKTKNNREVTLYNEKEIQENFKDLLSLPRVDKDTGVYRDPAGEDWVNIFFFKRLLGLDIRTIKKYFKELKTIEGRDKTGHQTSLYNKAQGLSILKKVDRDLKTTEFSPQEANIRLEEFFEKEEDE